MKNSVENCKCYYCNLIVLRVKPVQHILSYMCIQLNQLNKIYSLKKGDSSKVAYDEQIN